MFWFNHKIQEKIDKVNENISINNIKVGELNKNLENISNRFNRNKNSPIVYDKNIKKYNIIVSRIFIFMLILSFVFIYSLFLNKSYLNKISPSLGCEFMPFLKNDLLDKTSNNFYNYLIKKR